MKYALLLVISIATINLQAQILSYSDFRTPDRVESALTTLATTYPTLTRLHTIGTSLEGRPIKALKISDNPDINEPSEGDVVFISLMHSREWISVEVLLYIADRILLEYSSNSELEADVNAAQIWIIPIANPDGYEYTHSTYRLWRKNRRDNEDGTFGVDLNRNWGYQWGLDSGSSGATMMDDYRGSSPFSEPENQIIRDFIANLDNFKTFVSYHSFSEKYLRPWQYTTEDPPGESVLRSIVQRNTNLIQAVHGHVYNEAFRGIVPSGEATDFIWEEHRAAPFTVELRPLVGTDAEPIGFILPPTEILPCAEENYPAAIAMLHDAARTGIFIRDHGSDTGSEPSAVWTGSEWSTPFWVSPDIWTVPATLNQNEPVDLNIRVNNSSETTQDNVTLEVYFTDPRISLEFPNPYATLIGTRIISVPPSGTVETFSWTTPVGPNSWGELHWCVGALVKHERDMPLTTQIQRSSNVSCRNFVTTEIIEPLTLTIAARNFLKDPAELIYTLDKNSIKKGWKIELPKEVLKRTDKLSESSIRKSKLLKTKGFILEPGESIYLPLKVTIDEKVEKGDSLIVNINGTLLPLVAGKREAAGNGFTYKLVKGK